MLPYLHNIIKPSYLYIAISVSHARPTVSFSISQMDTDERVLNLMSEPVYIQLAKIMAKSNEHC